jgi:hypothetical protein
MSAAAFAEVIGNPYEIWVAPVGTAFPDVDEVPDDIDPLWAQFGVNGIDNQGDGGVTVTIGGGNVNKFTPAGRVLPVKGWRTEQNLMVAFSVVDTTVENLARILDDAAVTTTAPAAGVPGKKSVSLELPIELEYVALLARGLSPYDDGSGEMIAQYLFTRVSQEGDIAPVYQKGTPAELACEFAVYGDVEGEDPALYEAQTDAATT